MPYETSTDNLRRYLVDNDFYYKQADKLPRLMVLAERCDRGQLSYEAYPVAELRRYAIDRGMYAAVVNQANKRELVQDLEYRDRVKDGANYRRKFSRFLDLPPELRNAVYSFYMKSLGIVPKRFAQPPLCKASSQLRSDSLGLFYEQSTFSISIIHSLWNRSHRTMFGQTKVNSQSDLFVGSVPAKHFNRIKRLHVELESACHTSTLNSWTIDLATGQCEINFGRHRKKRLKEAVNSVMARGGTKTMGVSDLDLLKAAVVKDFHDL